MSGTIIENPLSYRILRMISRKCPLIQIIQESHLAIHNTPPNLTGDHCEYRNQPMPKTY